MLDFVKNFYVFVKVVILPFCTWSFLSWLVPFALLALLVWLVSFIVHALYR